LLVTWVAPTFYNGYKITQDNNRIVFSFSFVIHHSSFIIHHPFPKQGN
jgi:hypothetical protein